MRRYTYLLLILAAVLLTYGPIFHSVYGFGDDFILFFGDRGQEKLYLADGRPLFALSQVLFHRHTYDLADLLPFRLLCAVGTAGIAMVYFHQLRRFAGDPWERMAISVALATLPCLHDYICQAVAWLAPFAGLAAISAALLTQRACSGSLSRSSQFVSIISAMLLMLVAAATYQPMLSWFWAIVFLMTLDRRFLRSPQHRKHTYSVLLWGFFYFGLCFVAMKSFFWLTGIAPKSRLELTQDPLEKIYWLLRIQLPQSLNFWQLMEVPSGAARLVTAAMTASIILSGFVLTYARLNDNARTGASRVSFPLSALWMVTAGGVLMMTHVHWLVIADVPQSYRIIAPLCVSAFIAVYWAFTRWTLWIKSPSVRQRVRQTVSVLVAIVGVGTAQHYSERYWIEPHQLAYRVLLHEIRKNVSPSTTHLHVIRQESDEGLTNKIYIECFARPAFERSWAIEDFVRLGLRDSGVDATNMRITNGSNDEPVPVGIGTVVLDMRTIMTYRRPTDFD